MIRREESGWVLYNKRGDRVIGTHKTYKDAKAQERAIQYSKSKKK
jgi:hypothetical protein